MDDKLARIIEMCGMSDEEVARLLDVGRKTVTRWRREETCPHHMLIEDLVQRIIEGSKMSQKDLQFYVNYSEEIEEKLKGRVP
jgi:DNA-binding XRE family transcriptional regulator